MELRVSVDGRVRIEFEGGTTEELAAVMAAVSAELEAESEPGWVGATLRREDAGWSILSAQRHLPRIGPTGPEDDTSWITGYKKELAAALAAAGIEAQASPD